MWTAIRRGFTLLEATIAAGIGITVGALVLYAYTGANKAQSLTVCSNMMKLSGQASLSGLYGDVNRARRLYGRPAAGLLARMPIDGFGGTATPGVPSSGTNVILPVIVGDGSFAAFKKDGAGNQGTSDPNFDAANVGNSLFFVTEEPPIEIHDGATTFHSDAFGSEIYRFTTYRFHFVFLARRTLPTKSPKMRSDVNWVYQLMHFTSAVYLNEEEVEGWMSTLKSRSSSSPNTFITTKLTALRTGGAGKPTIGGAVDFSSTTASTFFRKLQATTVPALDNAAANTLFVEGTYKSAVKFDMRQTFGESFVAFNTLAPANNAFPGVKLKSLGMPYEVPSYASKDTGYPYGFETMIIGAPLGRQVLMHLTLATFTYPARVMLGEAFQQIAACQEF